MKKDKNLSVLQLTRQDVPDVKEDTKTRYDWIPIGIESQDDYYEKLTDAYNTSTTNAACIDGTADLLYGKGLATNDEEFSTQLQRLVKGDELRKVFFDLKLYGNAAWQVKWNKEHTKIVKLHHIPVQLLRAEKITMTPQVENYYYCTDWSDMRKQKQKIKIPAFGTSTEEREILYIKEYEPNRFYYSLPDWISALQFSQVEAELSNLHINNIENGFLPLVMVNLNNGVPAPEERDVIENMIEHKFTGTKNAGRFMVSFNDDKEAAPSVESIQVENLHEKYQYVAEYAQDRILVAHRIVSPLLFGIRTANNGFSSQSEEMKTAYSIFQTMTIQPFQSLVLDTLYYALLEGGYGERDLYIEQLTPLVILADTADDTDQTVEEAEQDVNDAMINTETQDEEQMEEELLLNPSKAFSSEEYEIL